MATEYCTKMSELTLDMLGQWQKICTANLKLCEKLFHSQVELASSLCDVVCMNGEEISQTKDVKDIASLQAEIAQVSGKLILENAQSTASILAEAGKSYSQFCETALKSGSEFAKPANASSKSKKAA